MSMSTGAGGTLAAGTLATLSVRSLALRSGWSPASRRDHVFDRGLANALRVVTWGLANELRQFLPT
jgi:hypothetical protein